MHMRVSRTTHVLAVDSGTIWMAPRIEAVRHSCLPPSIRILALLLDRFQGVRSPLHPAIHPIAKHSASVTTKRVANASYIQSPRLQTAFPANAFAIHFSRPHGGLRCSHVRSKAA
jgi:hypothetical protein